MYMYMYMYMYIYIYIYIYIKEVQNIEQMDPHQEFGYKTTTNEIVVLSLNTNSKVQDESQI